MALHQRTAGLGCPAVPHDVRLSTAQLSTTATVGLPRTARTKPPRRGPFPSPRSQACRRRAELPAGGPGGSRTHLPGMAPSIDDPGPAAGPITGRSRHNPARQGGVYRALDLGGARPALWSRRAAGMAKVDWDGRDGAWRVRHEVDVLSALSLAGVPVAGVQELSECCRQRVRRHGVGGGRQPALPSASASASFPRPGAPAGLPVRRHRRAIHEAGFAWRDCKPLNFINNPDSGPRPVDFEGAVAVGTYDSALWGKRAAHVADSPPPRRPGPMSTTASTPLAPPSTSWSPAGS